MSNDGKKPNEQVFWDYFYSKFGEDKKEHFPLFDEFYNNEFLQTKAFCKPNPLARKIMDYLKENNLLAVLASRPVFPYNGMINRAGFVDLKKEDFALITDYSVCSYSKPNPKYYQEILDKLGLKAEEALMFGNNEEEDGCAEDIGIKTYMVGNYFIKGKRDRNLAHLTLEEIIPTIEKHLTK
jgi:FMN phosphatase YigB (HAD superfamily)